MTHQNGGENPDWSKVGQGMMRFNIFDGGTEITIQIIDEKE